MRSPIEAALRAVFAATCHAGDAAAHRVVLERIRLRNPERANAAMLRLIDITAAVLEPRLTDNTGVDKPRRRTQRKRR